MTCNDEKFLPLRFGKNMSSYSSFSRQLATTAGVDLNKSARASQDGFSWICKLPNLATFQLEGQGNLCFQPEGIGNWLEKSWK